MRSVVITGVSSGIGHGCAEALAQRGYRVFGSVRKTQDAERLKAALGETFVPLVFDVTDAAAVNHAAAEVASLVGEEGLAGLVNNAGISQPGPLAVQPAAIVRQHLEVNVMGVVHAVQAFLPLLRRAKPAGRIVNMSSLSGRIAFPFVGAYAASKHALEALSDSLRRELLIYGVDVIVIEPGAIDTPIWDKAGHVGTTFEDSDWGPVLSGFNPADTRRAALPVSAVAERVIAALEHRRPRTRYALPDQPLKYWIAPRLLPDRWLDRIVDRVLNYRKLRDRLAERGAPRQS
ncbi:MAG: SDR family NAD(P)-dependent oxidoreductase [Alphaproteobacteria bacterium]|nr:SDR family NAD(P)-dependent oxidoreductase [Alphaproteobacteria bacterium]